MLDRVRDAPGQLLCPAEAYRDDTGQYWEHIHRFDKLERIQHFREPGDLSWEAFAAGRWAEAMELLRKDLPSVRAEFAEDSRLGLTSYRVRVVEFPIVPYLHWEFYALKLRAECGENIRVVESGKVARHESNGILVPELIFMETQAMYEVLYDEKGVLSGGRKIVDPELIDGCRSDVQALYDQGEDLASFFEREIAPFPAPTVDP